MAALKKGTKLTNNPKDFMLRVRMDQQTLEKLDKLCKFENLDRSGIVRKWIEQNYKNLGK